MKETYESPELEVVEFEEDEIWTAGGIPESGA